MTVATPAVIAELEALHSSMAGIRQQVTDLDDTMTRVEVRLLLMRAEADAAKRSAACATDRQD